jgi:hypothetical protein
MKIYVAGASKEIETAERWIKECENINLEITHDWTKDVRKSIANPNDYVSTETLYKCAEKDYFGVIRADILWVLSTEGLSRGLHTEAGIGLTSSRLVTIVSGPDWQKNIFFYLFKYQFATHEAAFELIKKLQEKR